MFKLSVWITMRRINIKFHFAQLSKIITKETKQKRISHKKLLKCFRGTQEAKKGKKGNNKICFWWKLNARQHIPVIISLRNYVVITSLWRKLMGKCSRSEEYLNAFLICSRNNFKRDESNKVNCFLWNTQKVKICWVDFLILSN